MSEGRFTKVIQPVTWAGMQKGGPDSPMVCGACPDWQACAEADRCARATDEDYKLPSYMRGPVPLPESEEEG